VYLVYEFTINQTKAATLLLVYLYQSVLITVILFHLLYCSSLITLQVILRNVVYITF